MTNKPYITISIFLLTLFIVQKIITYQTINDGNMKGKLKYN